MFNRLAAFATFGFLTLSSAVSAFEMGPLNPMIELGESGAWDVTDEGDFLVLSNNDDDGALRYYFGVNTREGHGPQTASVEIDFRNVTPSTRGGLIFGVNEADRTYFMFIIGPKGEMAAVQRTSDGFQELFSGTIGSVGDGVNTIRLEESAENVRITVNDGASYVTSRPGMLGGGMGVVALGKGEVAFRNYTYRAE